MPDDSNQTTNLPADQARALLKFDALGSDIQLELCWTSAFFRAVKYLVAAGLAKEVNWLGAHYVRLTPKGIAARAALSEVSNA